MDQLKTTRLTAAKICHEIAGHLSVMKFLQDDLKFAGNNEDYKMLCDGIDMLSNTMDLFRNLYSSSKQKNGIDKIIYNIYKLKGIYLSELSEIFEAFSNSNEENILACMLYIVMKSSRQRDAIKVEEKKPFEIEIFGENLALPSSVINAINDDDCEEDIFNVLVKYAKTLAKLEKIQMGAEVISNGGLRIKIWK